MPIYPLSPSHNVQSSNHFVHWNSRLLRYTPDNHVEYWRYCQEDWQLEGRVDLVITPIPSSKAVTVEVLRFTVVMDEYSGCLAPFVLIRRSNSDDGQHQSLSLTQLSGSIESGKGITRHWDFDVEPVWDVPSEVLSSLELKDIQIIPTPVIIFLFRPTSQDPVALTSTYFLAIWHPQLHRRLTYHILPLNTHRLLAFYIDFDFDFNLPSLHVIYSTHDEPALITAAQLSNTKDATMMYSESEGEMEKLPSEVTVICTFIPQFYSSCITSLCIGNETDFLGRADPQKIWAGTEDGQVIAFVNEKQDLKDISEFGNQNEEKRTEVKISWIVDVGKGIIDLQQVNLKLSHMAYSTTACILVIRSDGNIVLLSEIDGSLIHECSSSTSNTGPTVYLFCDFDQPGYNSLLVINSPKDKSHWNLLDLHDKVIEEDEMDLDSKDNATNQISFLDSLHTRLYDGRASVRKSKAMLAQKEKILESSYAVLDQLSDTFALIYSATEAIKPSSPSLRVRRKTRNSIDIVGMVPLLDHNGDDDVLEQGQEQQQEDDIVILKADAWSRGEYEEILWVRVCVRNISRCLLRDLILFINLPADKEHLLDMRHTVVPRLDANEETFLFLSAIMPANFAFEDGGCVTMIKFRKDLRNERNSGNSVEIEQEKEQMESWNSILVECKWNGKVAVDNIDHSLDSVFLPTCVFVDVTYKPEAVIPSSVIAAPLSILTFVLRQSFGMRQISSIHNISEVFSTLDQTLYITIQTPHSDVTTTMYRLTIRALHDRKTLHVLRVLRRQLPQTFNLELTPYLHTPESLTSMKEFIVAMHDYAADLEGVNDVGGMESDIDKAERRILLRRQMLMKGLTGS